MISFLKLLFYSVVLARPTESASTHENDTEEDSGPSSTEDCNTNEVSTNKEKSKLSSRNEMPSSPDKYSSLMQSLDISNKDDLLTEYSSPRPPDFDSHLQCDQKRHECEEIPKKTGSALSLSEIYPYTENQRGSVSRGLTPGPSLSTDDLTMDARACAVPRRRRRTATKPKLDKLSKDHTNAKDKDKEKTDENIRYQDSIEDFIKHLVSTQIRSEPKVSFFDAAIVYEKEDYIEALNFKEETLMIVKSDYNEEIRIELFDSEVFAQSKVCVVQDVIDKCSMIFVYLTNNFRSPELRFFVEEAIGICRLQLGNNDVSSGFINNDKQWIVKPVHTAPPKMRAYKVPSGLLTISGIDWYDKHTEHTQQKIRAVIRTAYHARKQREMETFVASYPPLKFNMSDKGASGQGVSPPTSTASAKHMSNRKREHINSNTSMDAFSLVGNMHQYSCIQGQQNSYHAEENISGLIPHTPPIRGYYQGSLHDTAPGQYVSTENSFRQMLSERNAYRSPTTKPLTYNQVQTVNGPQVPIQAERFFSGYQQTNSEQGYIVQSAGMQGHNTQHMPNVRPGNASYPMAPIQPGNVYQQTFDPRIAGPQTYYGGHLQSGQNHSQVFKGMPFNPAHYPQDNQYTSNGNRGNNNNNFQLPLPQQDMNIHQSNRFIQNQSLSRDAYPSEHGNFLRDQRNDAPSPTQLSVVSKVTGNLIVNPNLSTDDVEIDQGDTEHTSNASSGTKDRRTKQKHFSQNYKSTDSDESSNESDCDFLKRKKNRTKKKTVFVYGSKIVQIGRRNKVVEGGNKHADDVDKSRTSETKREQAETKSSVDCTINSLPRASEGSFAHVKSDLQSTSENNILSTDNISVENQSDPIYDKDLRVSEKVLKHKVILPDKDSFKDDKKFEERPIQLLNINAKDIEHANINGMNIKSNDRYSRGYSEKFSSIQYHGSANAGAFANLLEESNENEDSLFEGGTYNDEITVTVAPFMFSKAREMRAGFIQGGSLFLKAGSHDMCFTNEAIEID